jgi:hypothetical protein
VRGFHHAQRNTLFGVGACASETATSNKEGKEKRDKNKDRSQAHWHVRAALRALDFISHQAFLLAVSDTEKARIWLRSRQKIRRKQVCS